MEIDLTDLPNPETVQAAVEVLLADLGPEYIDELRATAEEDLINHHMGLGLFIRNVFGLYGDNKALLSNAGADNADDASMVIVEALASGSTPPSTPVDRSRSLEVASAMSALGAQGGFIPDGNMAGCQYVPGGVRQACRGGGATGGGFTVDLSLFIQ